MFSKLCVLAVVIPLISALTLNAPTKAVSSSGPITLTWTSDATDQPVFSLEMVNEEFHDTFAIANNVHTSDGNITLTLPSVPVNREYTIEAVNISNVNDVLATTPPFNIGPEVSSSESSTTTSNSSGGSSGSSGPVTTVTPVGASSTSFGVTRSNTATGTTTPTGSAGTSSGANAPSGSNFGNSGLPVRLNVNKGFIASAALSLVAGAAIVAL